MTNTKKSSFFMLCLMLNYILMTFLYPTIVYIIPMPELLTVVLNQVLLFAIPIILYFLITRDNIKETLSLNPLGFKNGIFTVILAFAIQPFMMFLSVLSTLIFPNYIASVMSEYSLPTLIFGIAILPALFEEITFRGIIYGNIKKGQPFWRAALITGLFFGIMHFNGQQFLYAFFAGVLSCFLIKKTNTIYSTMLAHFTINASQSILVFYQNKYLLENGISMSIDTTTTTWDGIVSYIALSLFFVILSLPILYFAYKGLNSLTEENINGYSVTKEKILDLPFFLIIFIYIIIITLIKIA